MNKETEDIFEELMKIANGTKNYCSLYRKECNSLLHYYRELNNQKYDLKQENERLNNIINEFEKWLEEHSQVDFDCNDNIVHEQLALSMAYEYLKELKGEKNNARYFTNV